MGEVMPYSSLNLGGVEYLIDALTQQHKRIWSRFVIGLARRLWRPLDPDLLAGLDATQQAIVCRAALEANVPEDYTGFVVECESSVAYLFWLLARGNHPELTYEKCMPLIDEGNVGEVLAHLIQSDEDSSTAQPPSQEEQVLRLRKRHEAMQRVKAHLGGSDG